MVAIPSGNTIKLVPDSNVKNSGIPYDSRNRVRGDQIVTRVIWLENTNPNDLIPAPSLMPQFAHMAAIAGTMHLLFLIELRIFINLKILFVTWMELGKMILKRSRFSRAKQKKNYPA